MEKAAVIQVGIKALRTPSGEFKEAMPIYMTATPELVQREEALVASLEVVDAHFLKDYIEKRDKVAAHAEVNDDTDEGLEWWQK